MDQSNKWLIINQANKVSSISDMHSYTPEQVNHSVADLQVLSTNCQRYGTRYTCNANGSIKNEDP